jgi:hypothetical protein
VNHDTIQTARVARAAVAALLESRTQAQPAWSRKALQSELRRLGIKCSLRAVKRYVNAIRGEAEVDVDCVVQMAR